MRRTRTAAAAALALGLALPVAAGGQGSSPAPETNPCLRPELHLRCPDLTMRRATGLHLVRTRDGRRLLAAANAIVNVGRGPLEIRATRVSEYHMSARQVLRAVGGPHGGRPIVLAPSGRVDYYDTHARGVYWKFRHAARFELWRLDATGRPVALVRVGPKAHYCFRDLKRVHRVATGRPYPRSPRVRQFGSCETKKALRRVTLGTSVGWADIYPSGYPQNAVSVTGLRGCFAYVLVVDPLTSSSSCARTTTTRAARSACRGRARPGAAAPT